MDNMLDFLFNLGASILIWGKILSIGLGLSLVGYLVWKFVSFLEKMKLTTQGA